MNNQKETKLNEKDRQIATLKRNITAQKKDISALSTILLDKDKMIESLNKQHFELMEIKTHWLYRLVNYFKR